MAFFRFPYTSFNQINLDWIMKTLKKLEPAATLVEDAAATLAEAQQTAAEAQETAEAAQDAIGSVTAQAAAAVITANEAKDIAQQAASAMIADGSVTRVKLGSDVTSELDQLGTDVAAAQQTGSNALGAAGVAQRLANQAQQTASSANTAAQSASEEASAAATQAETAAASAASALSQISSKLTIIRVADATSAGTNYDLTGYDTTRFAMIVGSAAGANHNSIFYVDTQANRIRLLGNAASGITPTISAGVVRLVSSTTANVWLCPLPF